MKILLQILSLLLLCSCQDGDKEDIFASIVVNKDGDKELLVKEGANTSKVILPNGGDVKNFQTLGLISLNNDNVSLITNWGGGKRFYTDTFYFQYYNDTLYLKKIHHETYMHDKDSSVYSEKVLAKPLPINNISITDYLQ